MAHAARPHQARTEPTHSSRVSKRLNPGDNGTKGLLAQYGDALVCVRYRQDHRKRYTTVELIVDETDLPYPSPRQQEMVGVAIDYRERQLRQQAKQAGATWNAELRLWLMSRDQAQSLGLEARIQDIARGGQ